MTNPREHLTTWIGLAVGLGLAWAGWEWWYAFRESCRVVWRGDLLAMLGGSSGGSSGAEFLYRENMPWTLHPWTGIAIIAGLVLVALLCTVAGAMIGNRMRASES